MIFTDYYSHHAVLTSALARGELRAARDAAHGMHMGAYKACKQTRKDTHEYYMWKDRYSASKDMWSALVIVCESLMTLGVYTTLRVPQEDK